MTVVRLFIGRLWPLWAAIAAAAMLAIAHAAESFGHLPPCQLCLRQREVYWVALWVGVLGWRLELALPHRRFGAVFCGALALIFLYQAGLAGYHAGVEWKWWPGPQSCSGQGKASAQDLAALLNGAQIKGPSCEVAAWRGLGLSMAGWNALAALGLAVLSAASCAVAWAARPPKAMA
jgi:disulfide bond formation protein DsbB